MVKKRLGQLILFIIVLIFPIFNRDPFILNILITTGIWATSVWGVRLIMSTGQLTLGHAAYMAVGAILHLAGHEGGLSFCWPCPWPADGALVAC
jgi:branched-chain amino acid transport system permease protein